MSNCYMKLCGFRIHLSKAKGFEYMIVDWVDDHVRNGVDLQLIYERRATDVPAFAEFLEIADALTLSAVAGEEQPR